MPTNDFTKEERVVWPEVLEAFEDGLVLSNLISKYVTDPMMMERSGDSFWRPMPYILRTFSGLDQTSNFQDVTQLSVPASIDTIISTPMNMGPLELRDMLQESRLAEAARTQLASQINFAIMNMACNTGSIFIRRTGAATGFDDVAAIEATLNEQGVPMADRKLALSSRDYNNMASNLSTSTRSFGNNISDNALRKAYVGDVSGFSTYKLDYAISKTAAAGGAGITMSTLAGAGNFFIPRARSVATTGQASNVDPRFQVITVTSTSNVAVGDAFTIAGVTAVHHITKGVVTGANALKTFRVTAINSGTTMTITPPIISGQGGTAAEAQYQNVSVSPSATAGITFLNTQTAAMNPFWVKDALEILPGRLAIPSGNGVSTLRGTTKNGIELSITKSTNIDNLMTKYRFDVMFGLVNKQPQMSGVIMFSQT